MYPSGCLPGPHIVEPPWNSYGATPGNGKFHFPPFYLSIIESYLRYISLPWWSSSLVQIYDYGCVVWLAQALVMAALKSFPTLTLVFTWLHLGGSTYTALPFTVATTLHQVVGITLGLVQLLPIYVLLLSSLLLSSINRLWALATNPRSNLCWFWVLSFKPQTVC